MKSWMRRLLCERCPLNPLNDDHAVPDRRKVSQDVREGWEEWQREKEDVEQRLRLVEMQSRVIAHVTGVGQKG